MYSLTKKLFLSVLAAGIAGVGCSDSNDPASESVQPGPVEPPFEELVPEETLFTNAELLYYGDDDGTGISVHYQLSLYTDMEIDEVGNPIGPGRLMRLSLNASFPGEDEEPVLPEGTYGEPENSYAFLPFTFNEGYLSELDLPTGKVLLPQFSFFGELAAGTTEYDPDLLREGACKVERAEDGTWTVSGVLVGTHFLKRYFSYTGELTAVDKSEEEQQVSNSNLTGDIDLTTIRQARLEDRGNRYYLPEDDGSGKPNKTSYRAFTLYLAEEGVDLSGTWPTQSGKLLQLEFFVPYETDVNEGVPAGDYEMTVREDYGLDRSNILPFNMVPGYPDKFSEPEGCWYWRYAGAEPADYARITEGTMTVKRTDDGGHTFEIDLVDCAQEPHKIHCTYSQTEPIAVYAR